MRRYSEVDIAFYSEFLHMKGEKRPLSKIVVSSPVVANLPHL